MRPSFPRSAALLALSVLSLAGAAGRITSSFTVPGALPDAMNDQQQTVVGLMVVQARNALSGIDARTSEPWPCVPGDTVAAFMTPNSLTAYSRLKSALATQGWKLQKEVKAPGSDQYSVLYSKGGVNMIGMWAAAMSGPRSTVFFCQRAANWKPAAPAPQAVSAPRLSLPFSVPLQGWTLGTRSVIGLGYDANGTEQLLTRGTVSPSGRLNLNLPQRPNPALLRPASEWSEVFGLGECGGTIQGSLKVSAPKVLVAKLEDIRVLRTAMPMSATAAQMLAAPVEPDHTIWSGNFATGIQSIRLVYSSAPLTVQGTLRCSDDGSTVRVSVGLPGGWSALVDAQSETGVRTLLMPTGGAELQDWHDSNF